MTLLQGAAIFGAGLLTGLVCLASSYYQAKVCANGIAAIGNGHDVMGKTLILAAFPELYAIPDGCRHLPDRREPSDPLGPDGKTRLERRAPFLLGQEHVGLFSGPCGGSTERTFGPRPLPRSSEPAAAAGLGRPRSSSIEVSLAFLEVGALHADAHWRRPGSGGSRSSGR